MATTSAWCWDCSSRSSRTAATSQRRLAADLGIAVGLVNAYLNRCIKKGLVKVTQAPARRYAYYLTPQGFVEKSRLSLEYLTYSFKFFRQAKLDCLNAFEAAQARGIARVALDGVSDIAEIATICARETDVEIVAIVDGKTTLERFAGIPIVRNYACRCRSDRRIDCHRPRLDPGDHYGSGGAVWRRACRGPSLLQRRAGTARPPYEHGDRPSVVCRADPAACRKQGECSSRPSGF